MDYLNYGKKVQTQPEKPQPQGFVNIEQKAKPQLQGFGQQKVQLTPDDFSFGDLNQQTTQPQIATPPSPSENRREIIQLFPIPVSISSIPFNYEKELEWIKKNKFNKKNCVEGETRILNRQSDDSFILDSPELENIRLWIKSEIDVFVKSVMGSDNELVITQSWLNKNEKGQEHHEHMHPNSIISGVWYPQIHEKLPPIKFINRHQPQMNVGVRQYNTFNSSTFMLPLKMGELLIFPSHLTHGVPSNQSDEVRISLSFNTWAKGSIGNLKSLTYLPIERCV